MCIIDFGCVLEFGVNYVVVVSDVLLVVGNVYVYVFLLVYFNFGIV